MRLIAIQWRAFLRRFITHATWLHLRRIIAIQLLHLKDDDLHPRVSSEPLMRFIGRLRPNHL